MKGPVNNPEDDGKHDPKAGTKLETQMLRERSIDGNLFTIPTTGEWLKCEPLNQMLKMKM